MATQYCVNHPTTETLLHCYRCGKPICTRCATRTPVGLICRACLTNQRSGYYNATALDYVLTTVVGLVLSFIGGLIAARLGGLWFVAIFFAPFAGGLIAEAIRFAIGRRRGQYIWLVACATVLIGAFFNIGGLPILMAILTGQAGFITRALFNFGFWIYVALAVGTVYARLRV